MIEQFAMHRSTQIARVCGLAAVDPRLAIQFIRIGC